MSLLQKNWRAFNSKEQKKHTTLPCGLWNQAFDVKEFLYFVYSLWHPSIRSMFSTLTWFALVAPSVAASRPTIVRMNNGQWSQNLGTTIKHPGDQFQQVGRPDHVFKTSFIHWMLCLFRNVKFNYMEKLLWGFSKIQLVLVSIFRVWGFRIHPITFLRGWEFAVCI